MPHRIVILLSMFSAVDWKALFLFMTAAAFMPKSGLSIWWEAIMRIALPIVGGIIWVFLKPKIVKWRNKMKK